MKKNYSYVTLLSSENYLLPVLLLNASLINVHSKYPLTVAVTEDLPKKVIDILISNNVSYTIINRIHYTKDVTDYYENHSVLNTASKIEIFKLTQFKKLCYLDSDAIVLRNIDRVFTYLDGSSVTGTSRSAQPRSNRFFSGFMVICPENHDYNTYKCLLTHTDCFDGDMLAKVCFYTHSNSAYSIPKKYFMHAACFDSLNWIARKTVKAIHYVNNPKPWSSEKLNEVSEKKLPSQKLYEKVALKAIRTFNI